ncbi:MAG: LuxR C-terminal-related transcriptional regulator [Leptolyngbya sp. Prado105]|jgi:DNA-binding CsgD family transcriptional regulator|nr:LuxR C-terminal-related transcriptional regulator [Leptolyngbya sp. Prado105]
MTARLFSVAPDSQFIFTPRLQKRSSRCANKQQPNDKNRKLPLELPPGSSGSFMSQDALWSVLLDTMPVGVMLLTQELQQVYCNEQAKQLCDRLAKNNSIPELVYELCKRLIEEEDMIRDPLVMEYQDGINQFLRAQVRWMNLAEQTLLVVHLQDCYASLEEELAIEQVKYDFTDREAEVWCLLRQKYSYQEISDLLKITLNTVKTHVKNIYAKRKNLAIQQKIWYSR